MIIGQPGSGKSTTAVRIGEKLGLPVIHMDRDVYWLPGWQERSSEDRLARMHGFLAQDAWVFEGYNSGTFHIREARAELLIWLDLPVTLRAYRIVRRNLLNLGKSRPDLPEGCAERLSMLPEFFWYTVRTAQRNRLKAEAFFEQSALPKERLQSNREIDACIEGLV